MSEGTEGTQPEGGNSGYTPPASQEEFNRIIGERVERERAKFGDYDDLKAKAARLDELEESTRTEIEKAQDQAAQAQAEVDRIPEKVAGALRGHLVAVHGIDDEDADLFLTADDPDLLVKQAQRLVERGPDRSRLHVPREGSTTQPSEDELSQFTRQLFDRAQT